MSCRMMGGGPVGEAVIFGMLAGGSGWFLCLEPWA